MKQLTLGRCLSLAVCLAVAMATDQVDYYGHRVISIVPDSEEQLQSLVDLHATAAIDFWQLPSSVGRSADIHVSPATIHYVTDVLDSVNLTHKILLEDLGKSIVEEKRHIAMRRYQHLEERFDLFNYHPLHEITEHLEYLNQTNALVSTSVAGTTLEGRDIVLVTISTEDAASSTKPVLFFDCNIHAREWIAGAVCLSLIDRLSSQYTSDPEIAALVDAYDWKIVPIANPDGYSFTWTSNRLWRKNRNGNNGSFCKGVDCNRNFPIGFGGARSSTITCSPDYRGLEAFSERESSTLQNIMKANQGRVKAAVSIHSYSQHWMSAYGNQQEHPREYDRIERVMNASVRALEATYGTVYESGSIYDILYAASGTSTDYYYESEGVVYSYLVELRDKGQKKFILPPSEIAPTFEETFNGIKAMVNAM